jgi:chemotaxis protein methyltransferase CheR
MIGAFGPVGLARLRNVIAHRLGFSLHETKLGLVAESLKERLEATGDDAGAYLDRLECPTAFDDELRWLGQTLTVGETYFFRHMDQFRAFAEAALPASIAARAHSRQLRILSAGCASGEEAYSLAILLRERAVLPDWTVSIAAVDLSSKMLDKAARGRYSLWSLRETPPEKRERWFLADRQEFILSPSIVSAVTFAEHDLTRSDPEPWEPGSFDVVFCRNVLMYLTTDAAQRVVRRFARALAPNGYLFLGHAETLRELSQDFRLLHTHGAFYYQRKDDLQAPGGPYAPGERGGPNGQFGAHH